MTARVVVRDQLRADLPGWDVRAYGFIPGNVRRDKPVVSVWRTDLAPISGDSLNLLHPVTVNLYGSRTAGEEVEEELDGLLDLLMLSLQRLDKFTWSGATRTVWGKLSGWQITGSLTAPDQYAATIRKESRTP